MEVSEPPPAGVEFFILAGVFLFCSMLFSASESAFLSINKLRVRFLRMKKNPRAIRTGKLLEKKEILLNSLLVGNNLVNIALATMVSSFALNRFGQQGVVPAIIIFTVIILIVGEIFPKTFAAVHPEPVALFLSGFVRVLVLLLSPLAAIFTAFSRVLSRLIGAPYEAQKVSFTEDEIKSFIDIGEEAGVLAATETTMMRRVFKFTDLAAKDIMSPRTKIISIPLFSSYRDTLELSQISRFSRFPVYDTDIDDMVGILYVKDMLVYAGCVAEFSVKKVMRPPIFIPSTKKMSVVQQILHEQKQSLAIVIDEYSGTMGLLTAEDIAREIFGKIADEYDAASKIEVSKLSDDELIFDGSVKLNAVRELLDRNLFSVHFETIGGYMIEHLGVIPAVGNSLTRDGCRFTVAAMSGNKVQRVHVRKLASLQNDEAVV